MQLLNSLWRMIAKFGALTFIFVGGGLLATVILPLATMLPSDKSERAQILVRLSFRFYLLCLQKLGVLKLQIKNAEALKRPGQVIIANHPSLLDVVILMSFVPRAQCIVKHQLWKHKTLGVLMRTAEYIRNDLSPDELISQCKDALEKGRSLIIFPEGTRTKLGTPPKFSRGFANIALLCQAPILPVYITCTPPHLYKGEPWWHVPSQKPVFCVVAGTPLDTKNHIIYGSRGLAARKLMLSIEQNYTDIIGHGQLRT